VSFVGITAWILDRLRRVPELVPANDPKPSTGAPPPGPKAQSYPGETTKDASPWVQIPTGPVWSVRNPSRSWVTQSTYVSIVQALTSYAASEQAPIVVLDASRKGGGSFPPHLSHREGRDIDLNWSGANKMPIRPLAVLLERLMGDGNTQAVFLDHGLQREVWDLITADPGLDPSGLLAAELQYPLAAGTGYTRIRHWKGHKKHLHARFRS
jgi:hypothetical protein